MNDYWIEHGQHIASAIAVKSRFALLTRFIDAEDEAGRLTAPLLPIHLDNKFLNRFRAWAATDPLIAWKKDEAGNWVEGMRRTRTASTIEESIIQIKAALNHAFRARRIVYVPPLQHKTRDQVTPERTFRLSVETIAEMLDYTMRGAGKYAGHPERLYPLRRYIIAAVCTLARPDAIFDMSVNPERQQWMEDERLFNLNQAGRIQTKKVRPTVPIVDLLHSWLSVTDDRFVCREIKRFDKRQQIEVIEQVPVMAVRSAWDSAREMFKIPDGFGPKLIRHSMATVLANRRVNLVELEMALGHRVLSKTSSRYALFGPEYLSTIRDGIEDVVSDLTRQAGSALHAKLTQNSENVVVLRA